MLDANQEVKLCLSYRLVRRLGMLVLILIVLHLPNAIAQTVPADLVTMAIAYRMDKVDRNSVARSVDDFVLIRRSASLREQGVEPYNVARRVAGYLGIPEHEYRARLHRLESETENSIRHLVSKASGLQLHDSHIAAVPYMLLDSRRALDNLDDQARDAFDDSLKRMEHMESVGKHANHRRLEVLANYRAGAAYFLLRLRFHDYVVSTIDANPRLDRFALICEMESGMFDDYPKTDEARDMSRTDRARCLLPNSDFLVPVLYSQAGWFLERGAYGYSVADLTHDYEPTWSQLPLNALSVAYESTRRLESFNPLDSRVLTAEAIRAATKRNDANDFLNFIGKTGGFRLGK